METDDDFSLLNDPNNELDKLRAAIFAFARRCVEQEKQKDGRRTEQQRRQASVAWIDELLEWRPLTAFSAMQLEFLELLIAYWRECEVEVAGVPEPDPLSPTQK